MLYADVWKSYSNSASALHNAFPMIIMRKGTRVREEVTAAKPPYSCRTCSSNFRSPSPNLLKLFLWKSAGAVCSYFLSLYYLSLLSHCGLSSWSVLSFFWIIVQKVFAVLENTSARNGPACSATRLTTVDLCSCVLFTGFLILSKANYAEMGWQVCHIPKAPPKCSWEFGAVPRRCFLPKFGWSILNCIVSNAVEQSLSSHLRNNHVTYKRTFRGHWA